MKSRLAEVPPEPESRVRLRSPLAEGPSRIERLEFARFTAANSPNPSVRNENLNRLADIDSYGMIIENTPYEDTKEQARSALAYRLSTYPEASVVYLSLHSNSEIIKQASVVELARRLDI